MEPNTNTGEIAPGHDKTVGILAAGLLLLLAILAGGWFMMQGQGIAPAISQNPATEGGVNTEVDAATVALSQQGTSDDVADIEADLTATDLGSLDDVSKI